MPHYNILITDLYIIETADTLFNMKEFLQLDEVVSSDTYLGTRMNQKALDFHTQLHDWSEAQKLSALANKHSQILNNVKNGEVYLPIKKLAHIEYWTRQVNRYYRPNRNSRPTSGSFMKIDVTKYNMKVDKKELARSKSALFPQRQRPVSAMSRMTAGTRRRFFGTDVHTVNNNLIESQLHYSAQRRDLYSATTRKSTKSAKIDDLKTEIVEPGISEINTSEKFDSDSETIILLDNTESSKYSQGHSHIDTEVMQPQIVSRSWSNHMLNVISIDDCKLTCRYRPQTIKENHKIPTDFDALQRARANKVRYDSPKVNNNKVSTVNEEEAVNGHEADDEAEHGEDTVDAVEERLNRLSMDDTIIDTNNNTTTDACHTTPDTVLDHNHEASKNITTNTTGYSENKRNGTTTSYESTEKSDRSHLRIHFNIENDKAERVHGEGNTSSHSASKTSYGRITSTYSNSDSSRSKNKNPEKKKVSRRSRINHAINDMVLDRKVMNTLDRDFDTRTAQFGRTIVEKTEGSDTFKKLHANLRKKMDTFVDTHSAVKTKEFLQRIRLNSMANSITSP